MSRPGQPTAIAGLDTSVLGNSATATQTKAALMNPVRELMYRFMTLSYLSKLDVARQLDLPANEEEGIGEPDLFLRYYDRAKTKGLLAKF